MLFGGILLGILVAKVFTVLMRLAKGDHLVQLSLGLVVAHITFLSSELLSRHLEIGGIEIKTSSIIATIVAAILVGEWERKNMSDENYATLRKIWEAFAFLANSIIFVLIGFASAEVIPEILLLIVPVLLTIFVVASGRAVSVYPVTWFINRTKLEEPIPYAWSHLLSWGSLRGALAMLMALSVPVGLSFPDWNFSFTPQSFILVLTVSCILFTLFVKGLTIKQAMNMLRVTSKE
jgi:CPA1 family monovalent cation:H+ antiporter